MDLRCIFVLVCLHVGCAEVAGAAAHKAFPGSVIGLPGSRDYAEWKRNDPDKSAYEPMGGSFRVGDLTPDTPNAEESPDDVEDQPEQPAGFYEKELAIEKVKAARHESLQGPFDKGFGKRGLRESLDETFLECDAHPERCKDEDLEEEAKQKAELETVTVDNVILDKDSDADFEDDDEPSKTKLVEFPFIKSHDDFFKNEPVKAANEMAAENSRAHSEFEKKLQDAGNPDVKIPVSIDYDKLKAEQMKNYDIDCDGPHGDPKNCQKYDGDDIDIESAEQAEHHHRVLAWHLATLANRNKYDDSYVPGEPMNRRFIGYRNFDADMPTRYDDIDSLNKNGALQRAEEIRNEDSTSGRDNIDTEEGTALRKDNAARLVKAHKKTLPKPTQAEKFAIAEKIKLAEAQDAKDTAQKDTERKTKLQATLKHNEKLAEKMQKKGSQGETWSDQLKASLPWSKTSDDQLAKKTKKSKTTTEHLRR